MKPSLKTLSDELSKRDSRPSFPRIKVLEYLMTYLCHPTVDQIFTDLVKEIPSLSKSTVYNTLNLFIEMNLVRALTIEDNEVRYDIVMENHGHFKCSSCGLIYNFSVDVDRFVSDDLRNFRITEKNVYFFGICPTCIAETEK